jgi:hypothetical protein
VNSNFPPIIDASKPGVLDLGEIVIFSLGNNAYILSSASNNRDWEPIVRRAFETFMPGSRLLMIYRKDGESPSYTALAENVDLRRMVEEMVVEALKKVME